MNIQFLFIYDSIIALIEIITAVFITWYIVRLKNKTRATWWFAGFFFAITLVCTAFFLEASILLLGDLFYPLQVVAGVGGQMCLIQFIYHFPISDQPREARIVRRVSLGVVLLTAAAAIHYMIMFFLASPLSSVPPFSLTILYIILPAGIVAIIVILLRRTIHHSLRDTEPGQPSLLAMVRTVIHPTNSDAVATRAFIGVFLVAFIPASSPLLLGTSLIPVPVAAYFAGLGILLVMVTLFLVYLNTARESSSFTARVFSISLVLLLALFGVVALITTDARNEQFRQKRLWQIAMVQQAALRNSLEHLPPEVAYIAAAPLRPGEDALSLVYEQRYPPDTPLPGGLGFIAAEDAIRRETGSLLDRPTIRTLDYVHELTSLPDLPGILRYADHSIRNIPRYVAYQFVDSGSRYEIGFRLVDDLDYINRENLKLITLLIASSMVLWLALFFFLRASLVKPLNALLDGVRRADAGDWTIAIPVCYEDEIGYLTHCFNRMLSTTHEAATRMEQHVSQRTADLARVNNRLIEEISKRRRIELALRESEEKYRSVSERANDGIVIVQDGLMKYCNARLAEMLACTVDEVEGKPFNRFLAPEYTTIVYENLAKRLRGEPVPARYEILVLSSSGQRIHAEINAGVMEYEGHQAVLAFVRDMTERKQAEEALRASEEQYRLLAENMHDVVWTLNLEGHFTYVSPSVYYLRGYTAEEVLQQSVHEALTPDSLQFVLNSMQNAIQQQSVSVVRVELEQPCKDGSTIWTECVTTPLLDSSGNLTGWVGVSRDITERRKTAAELQRAKEAAEAANRAKSIFLANMSHELRTPLNAILGFAQIMRRSHNIPVEHRDYAGIIYRSGEHLLKLINAVLDFSKIEADRMTLVEVSFNLSHLLKDLEDMFRLRAQDKGLLLHFSCAPDVPQLVCTDEVKLRQVLINLLSNAIKFTDEGSVTLCVSTQTFKRSGVQMPATAAENIQDAPIQHNLSTSGEHDGNADVRERSNDHMLLRFEVQDTGPGIAPDEFNQLFEAFTQTRTGQETQGGTGLGLAISRKFVQMMGGDITVASSVNRGTTFTVVICATRASEDHIQHRPAPHHVVALAPDQPCYRILIVDDRQDIRTLMVHLLDPVGFELREASNGQEAIAIWEQWEPHCIWMDMRMPVMNGYEATRCIKATTRGQATVIVALTASTFEEERHVVLSTGCDDFVRKPFREAEIFEMMQKHLGVRYIYAEEQSAPSDTTATHHVRLESASAVLAGLPPDLLTEMHQATMLGDIDALEKLITQVYAHDSHLAETLIRLAEDFQYDQLFTLIERAGTPDE